MGSLEYDKAMQEAGREAAQERVRQLEGVLAEARRWEGGRRCVALHCVALRLTWGGWMGLTEQPGEMSPRPSCSGTQELHTPHKYYFFFFLGKPRMQRAS